MLARFPLKFNSRPHSPPMDSDDDALFNFPMVIQGREFQIEFRHDGMSFWDDFTYRRRQRKKGDEYLEWQIVTEKSEAARAKLEAEIDRFTVDHRLQSDVMSFIEVAAEMFKTDNWTREHESRLDEILFPIFWEHINPQLEAPLDPLD